ncbi:MAG: insulinase family protein [Pseudomonadota bacterium]|nr:insulinase family protein [Pseudomonadota bacterium]
MSLSCLAASAQPVARSVTPASSDLPGQLKQITSVEGITEYRLPNGLQVLLVPDDSKPTTTVNVTYHVGSRMESYGETGMAHLLEHLLFKGTPTTQNLLGEFAKRGLRANGSTSYDRTNYFASFAANDANLRWYLSWQADAMVNSFIARKDLDTEMTVVRNEFEMGENNAGRVLLQKTMAAMFQWHNYGKSTIGARTDIENVSIPRLQAFYHRFYQPDNATLIISGRFDTAQVLTWVDKFFSVIPKPTRVIAPTYTLDPPQDGERTVDVRRVGGTPTVYMGFHVPAGSAPDFSAVELIASILGDTPGGRLHKQVVEKQLAAQCFGFAWDLAEPGVMLVGSTLAPGQDLDKARDAMAAAVQSLHTQPITAEEVERARTAWLNDWDQGYSDPERIGVALSEAIAVGDWRLYFLKRDEVRKLKLADVQRVADTWLLPSNRTVGLYEPTAKPDRAPQAERVDVEALLAGYKGNIMAKAVESFDATPANLDARTQRSKLASGLEVALLPKGTRGNAVQARLQLHFGDAASMIGQETVSTFAAALLDKGGAGMTRQQIADAFDKLQASVSFGGSGQTLAVGITTKGDRLPAVIELVGKLLRNPAYAAAPLDEIQRQWQSSIERQRKEPDAIISNRLERHGNPYPRGDLRYAPSFDEMQQNVAAVSVAKVADFQRRFYSAAHGEFAAVGSFDPKAVQAALATAFGDWPVPASGGPAVFVRVPQPLVKEAPERFVAITPDKANANMRAGLALPVSDRSPDHAALMLGNYIFGQGGSSRLWKRIRESEGLSYDVRSSLGFSSIDENTSWNLSAIFAPQNQPKVETALREELARSVKGGFTQAELDAGRAGLLNYRQLSRAQDAGVAGAMARNLYLDRSFAFDQATDAAIQALTLEQVNAAWRDRIHPDQLVIGWGGDFKQP